MNKKALRRLIDSRTMLVIEHPFYGVLMYQLKLVEAPQIETMAVDGVHLFYNPEFVLEQREDHLLGELAHEGLHCVYRHHTRIGNRDLGDWNKAGDYRINDDLLAAGFKLPDWVLHDKKFASFTTEDIYEVIRKEQQGGGGSKGQPQPNGGNGNQNQRDQQRQGPNQGQQGKRSEKGQGQADSQGNDQGSGNTPTHAPDPGKMGGVIMFAPDYDQTAIAAEDARWEMIAHQAVAVARAANAGQIPGYLKRLVKELGTPRVDWLGIFRRFVDESISKEESWNSPNRRFLHLGYVLPSLVPNKLNHIVSVIDTSGSVNNKLLQAYASEHKAFMDEGHCDKLTVIYADVDVRNVQVFERGDDIEFDPAGGGGTNFRKVMDYIIENCEDASVITFFTDLITRDFGENPNKPLLWLCYGNTRTYEERKGTVPFGEVVHVRL